MRKNLIILLSFFTILVSSSVFAMHQHGYQRRALYPLMRPSIPVRRQPAAQPAPHIQAICDQLKQIMKNPSTDGYLHSHDLLMQLQTLDMALFNRYNYVFKRWLDGQMQKAMRELARTPMPRIIRRPAAPQITQQPAAPHIIQQPVAPQAPQPPVTQPVNPQQAPQIIRQHPTVVPHVVTQPQPVIVPQIPANQPPAPQPAAPQIIPQQPQHQPQAATIPLRPQPVIVPQIVTQPQPAPQPAAPQTISQQPQHQPQAATIPSQPQPTTQAQEQANRGHHLIDLLGQMNNTAEQMDEQQQMDLFQDYDQTLQEMGIDLQPAVERFNNNDFRGVLDYINQNIQDNSQRFFALNHPLIQLAQQQVARILLAQQMAQAEPDDAPPADPQLPQPPQQPQPQQQAPQPESVIPQQANPPAAAQTMAPDAPQPLLFPDLPNVPAQPAANHDNVIVQVPAATGPQPAAPQTNTQPQQSALSRLVNLPVATAAAALRILNTAVGHTVPCWKGDKSYI